MQSTQLDYFPILMQFLLAVGFVVGTIIISGKLGPKRNSINKDKNTTILCLEFWSFDHEELWGYSDEQLAELAAKEIRTLNLIQSSSKILNTSVMRIPKCYPVYETGYMENLQPVIDYLKGFKNLYPIGRYGSFKYNNQDHSILMGILGVFYLFRDYKIKIALLPISKLMNYFKDLNNVNIKSL